MDQRVVAALESELAKHGLQKADSNPDLVATYHASTEEQKSYYTSSFGYGAGPGFRRRGGMGMGTSTTTEQDFTVGSLVVDLYEAGKKQLVFRGTASGTLQRQPRQKHQSIAESMEKIFEKKGTGTFFCLSLQKRYLSPFFSFRGEKNTEEA